MGGAVGHIGPEPAFHDLQLFGRLGMGTEHRNRLACAAPRLAAARRRFGQLDHRRVHSRLEHLGGAPQPRIFALVLEVRPIAADRSEDRLGGLGMRTDRPWQAQQLLRPFEVDVGQWHVLRDRPTLDRLALALLDIRSEPARLEENPLAQILWPVAGLGPFAALSELAGELAFGIVGARNERPIFPTAQRQLPIAARRAQPRIASVLLVGEQPGRQKLVERRSHFGRLLLHHFARHGLEVAPEGFEQLLPPDPPARHVVEPVLELRGIVVIDVTFEEPLEERRHQPTALLGNETVFLQPHIFPVLERLERRRIGRRPPNPQLLQPLDQRGFGKARRGLGKALHRFDTRLGGRITGLEQGHPRGFLVVELFVAAFLVKRHEAGKQHYLARRPERRASGSVDQFDRGPLEPG